MRARPSRSRISPICSRSAAWSAAAAPTRWRRPSRSRRSFWGAGRRACSDEPEPFPGVIASAAKQSRVASPASGLLRRSAPRNDEPIHFIGSRVTLAMELLLQQIANGVVIGSTYAVVAIGFALAFTVLRVINFAHPDTFMVGMFGGLLAGRLIADNVIVVLLGGAVGSAAVGLTLERLVIRPLRGRDVLMTLIGTLGVAIMLQNGVAAFMGPDPVAYPSVLPAQLLSLGPISLSVRQLANVAICVLILAAISYYVRGTKLGRATRAVAERA